MVTVDEFSRLVAGVYTAAVTPEYWQEAIRDIQHALGGTGGGMFISPEHAVWSIEVHEAVATSYTEYYGRLDHVLVTVAKGPVGAVRTGSELIAPNRHTEFYAGWVRPNELEEGLFVRLTAGHRPSSFVVAAPRRTEPFDTSERIKLMNGLVPHLQQALRIHNQLTAAVNSTAELAEALDIVQDGVIIIGAERRIIRVNSAGDKLLRSDDGLHSKSGRIGATNREAERELRRALQMALLGNQSGVRSGHAFVCRRPSGNRPYLVRVIPLHRNGTDARGGESSAAVFIKDPERETESSTTLLCRLYGMTNSEVEVATHLAQGASVKQIADELSVSYETVRTHLQHAYDKTDTHRQVELVRLLLALNPQIQAAPSRTAEFHESSLKLA